MKQVAFDVQYEARGAAASIPSFKPQDLFSERVHAATGFASINRPENRNPGIEPKVRNHEPARLFKWEEVDLENAAIKRLVRTW